MIMKLNLKILFAGLSLVLAGTSTLAQTDYSQCIEKKRSEWGEYCSACPIYRDSYVVYLQNICDETLDMQVAVQEENLTWKVYTFNSVAPEDSVRAYACLGKGKYLAWARVAGDSNTAFPTKAEVNREYRK